MVTLVSSEIRRGIVKWALKTGFFMVIMTATIFVSAGRLDWVMGWAYIGVVTAIQVVTACILVKKSPELLAERSQLQEGTRDWDKILAPLVASIMPLVIWLVAGLDVRFQWSPPISPSLQVISLIVVIVGALLATWAMAVNRFFSSTIRIQKELGQAVVTDGPYRYIRHPGYLGAIITYLATPFSLGSWWALAPAFLQVSLWILRTSLRDRILQEELPGYKEYTRRASYCLLPRVW